MSSAERIVLTVSVLCLLAGGYLRVAAAHDYLWLDELHTGWAVSGNLPDVYWRSAEGNQSPLFFYLCFAVVNLLGYSATALRAVSLTSGMLLLIGLPLIVFRATRCTATVLLVSLFLMLDYESVFYASEARPYGMLQWLGGLQAFCFWGWSRRFSSELVQTEIGRAASGVSFQLANRSLCNGGTQDTYRTFEWLTRWPVVSLLSATLVSTHVTGVWLLLAEAIFVACRCLVMRKWRSRDIWKCVALFLVLSLPAMLAATMAWQRRGNWATVSNVNMVLTQFAWAFGAMVVLPSGALVIDRLMCAPRPHDRKVSGALFTFITLWAVVPTLSIAGLDYFQVAPLGLARYAVVGSIALPLWAAFALNSMNSKVIRWATLLMVVNFLIWNSTVWLRPALPLISDLRNENWADAVATIAQGDSGYPILLAANVLEDVEALHNRSPRFQGYLKFPVLGADPNLKNPIIPLNTQGELFSDREADAVESAGGGWLIVRDLPENATWIIQQIEQNPQSSKWQFDLAQFPSPEPNYVLLFRITAK